MTKNGYVYILASDRNGTLYIGVTSNIIKPIHEHKTKSIEGFTKQHNVSNLVWFESHDNIENAILREKQLKKWNRAWKLKLIETDNPDWRDLYQEII